MSFSQKSCLFCLKNIDDGIEIFGPIGEALNAWNVIVKYFWFDLLHGVDSTETCVCSDCWLKVKSFHEFYLMVEALHNKCASEIEEVPKLESIDEIEVIQMEEEMVEFVEEVQLVENVVGLQIDMLDYETNIDDGVNFYEQRIESNNEEVEYYQQPEIEIELHSMSDVGEEIEQEIEQEIEEEVEAQAEEAEVEEPEDETEQITEQEAEEDTEQEEKQDVEQELELEEEQVADQQAIDELARKTLQTIKIHKISPLEPGELLTGTVARPKRGRPKCLVGQMDSIVCYICNESFATSQSLRRHFLLHDPEETQQFMCQICDQIFPRDYMLRDHIANFHEEEIKNEKIYPNTICPICDEVMEFESLKSHIKVVHCTVAKKKEKFPCKVCAKVYTDSDAFTKHTWTHMNETLTRVQCDICQRWLKNHHILRIHKQYHQTTPLECRHCGKIKYNNRSMKVHITAAHSTRKHKCNLCDKTFRRPISLKEHMAIHTGESLYNCSYCSKPFKSNANMYKHMREVHTEQWNKDRALKRQK